MAEKRDYSLTGPENERALQNGLATAQWYSCTVSRKELKELMKREDAPAIRDTAIWLGVILASGIIGYLTWRDWWCIPAFFIYGVMWGSASDSRWHECGHGTAFRTRWMNDAVYNLASFMIFREPTCWRWSHTRHHTDTIIVGRDPEIGVPRPPDFVDMLLNTVALKTAYKEIGEIARHCTGKLTDEEKSYIPEMEWPKVFRTARIWAAIYLSVILLALATKSWLPLMYVGLPTLYGAVLHRIFGLTQHAGLAEDVLDHRLNSRTIHMNAVSRFIYWNMNYHVEHHMFPMVPYHALPKLHTLIKADCPPPYPSTWSALMEIFPALLRQSRDPTYFIQRQLPPKAIPLATPSFQTAE